jgi:hypothetical protein
MSTRDQAYRTDPLPVEAKMKVLDFTNSSLDKRYPAMPFLFSASYLLGTYINSINISLAQFIYPGIFRWNVSQAMLAVQQLKLALPKATQ